MSETYYDEKIFKMANEYHGLYLQVLDEMFGKEITWDELINLDRYTKMKIAYELDSKITISKSKYSVERLAYAIQHSRSGLGGSAMTMFKCGLCGEEELWTNTAVPNICKGCAEKMARNIVLSKIKIEKD